MRARDELGGYRLHEMLARSGLGVIFRADDPAGGAVAVKILQPPFATEPTDVEQFIARIQTLAELQHSGIPRILSFGTELGAAWVAMEWLPRGSLTARLEERSSLPEAEVLAIGLQAAEALGAVGAAGLLHGDLEPNNLVFDAADSVRVTDFAQAALYEIAANDLCSVWGRAWSVSPERLRNETEEAPSDIYSLGAVLFHAFTGKKLHGGEPHGQIALELLDGQETRVEMLVPTAHEATARVLNRMLASDLSRRFQSWHEVSVQLHEAATLVARRDSLAPPAIVPARGASPRSAGWFWFWVSVVLAELIVLATLFAWQHRPGT